MPGFQSAARASAAKPRKPAKRKDKLSNSFFLPENWTGGQPGVEAENPGKRRESNILCLLKTVSVSRPSKKHGFRNAWPI
ncbi:hypothetical protein [Mesorhizobium sp. NZP2298]|uniref:hypothetical protein n=1 Tax=Mesorhizobium sp. NZP2298 TaxID=2483403 RepID=UPI0015565B67|nr:hypothetical protein [Mesorhizobium sp. NZP2298]